jgi:hypothetical protein
MWFSETRELARMNALQQKLLSIGGISAAPGLALSAFIQQPFVSVSSAFLSK